MMQLRRDWYVHIDSMYREMEQLLDNMSARKPPLVRFSPRAWEPNIDIYETADEVVLIAEIAGVAEEDITITVEGNVLAIKGMRREPTADPKRTYLQMEIDKGAFERAFLLPTAVTADEARASYREGLLQVRLPKTVQRRTIKATAPNSEAER